MMVVLMISISNRFSKTSILSLCINYFSFNCYLHLDECVIKPKVRRVERKLVPFIEKLSIEELMETNTYQKFNKCIEKVFESTDDGEPSLDFGNLFLCILLDT